VRLPLEEVGAESGDNGSKDANGLSAGESRIEIETKILHEGEVNRARYMP